jgi:MerR family copper efflux transcriptional regulator
MSQPDKRRHLPLVSGATALGASAGQASAQRSRPSEPLLLVGELAKATGKTVRAIHLYEDLGLLKPLNRSKGRYRQFSPDSVVRVRWIAKLQSLGLSLSEIQELVREQEESGSAVFAAARLREIYQKRLQETRNKVRQLRQLERELEASLAYLDSCDNACTPAEKTASCASCARHTEPGETPELVAGVHVS